ERRARLLVEGLETRLLPANILWIGGGGDSNWSTAGNWKDLSNSTNHVPASTDVAVFDNTQAGGSNANSTIDGSFGGTIAGLSVTNYTGTLTDSLANL